MNKKQQSLLLLPNYFNRIGFGLLLISIASIAGLIYLSAMDGVAKEITKNGIYLSLILLMLTKDKVEDELTIKLRLQSFAAAFIYGVVNRILNPYTNLFFGKEFLSGEDTDGLILGMIFFYFITFYFLKRKR